MLPNLQPTGCHSYTVSTPDAYRSQHHLYQNVNSNLLDTFSHLSGTPVQLRHRVPGPQHQHHQTYQPMYSNIVGNRPAVWSFPQDSVTQPSGRWHALRPFAAPSANPSRVCPSIRDQPPPPPPLASSRSGVHRLPAVLSYSQPTTTLDHNSASSDQWPQATHLYTSPQLDVVVRSGTREPYSLVVTPSCKRNPPPPPPPRSGSWTGRVHPDSSRLLPPGSTDSVQTNTSHTCVAPQIHYSLPVSTIVNEAKIPHQISCNSSVSCGAYQSCRSSACTSLPLYHTRMALPSTVPNSICSKSDRPSELNIVQAKSLVVQQSTSDRGQSVHLAFRAETTDTLLRLLIRHYTTNNQSCDTSSEPDSCANRDTMDRLLHAVCSTDTNRPIDPSYVDPQVASLAQRILPHLVRIIYTDVANSNVDDRWSNNPTNPTTCCDDSRPSCFNGGSGCVDSSLSVDSKLDLTTSLESHHSCADEHEPEEDTDSVLGVLDDKYYDQPYFTGGSDLDVLPPDTSVVELKNAAIQAIHRLVPVCQPDANLRERDLGIVRLLAVIHTYTITQQSRLERSNAASTSSDQSGTFICPGGCHPLPTCPVAEVAALVRLSFYPEHRTAICELGGVHVLIALLRVEHAVCTDAGLVRSVAPYPDKSNSAFDCPASVNQSAEHNLETSVSLRRYVCMALTNLTFGVAANKALLCRRIANLEALLAQLQAGSEELKQVSASVLRNLCWRTDSRSKAALRRVDAPRRLTIAAMTARRDSTLRTTLSALWNLSAHCSHNKRAVCSVDGVFGFLLSLLHSGDDITDRLVLVENSGGILRNISVVIAGREDYRAQLHQNNCYPIVIELLRNPPSLTVIVNVCGTLWNLTASPQCPTSDLLLLCRLGAVDLLHQLARSPHELVRNSSAAVLLNLVQTPSPSASLLLQQDQSPKPSPPDDSTSVETLGASDLDSTIVSSWPNPPHSIVSSTEPDDDDSLQPVAESDHSYRRRMSSRSRLRFGLLSVVLEADDADEEAAEESYNDDTDGDDENTYEVDTHAAAGSEGSIYPDQEALVADVPSTLLIGEQDGNEIASLSQSENHCSWNTLEAENDQACIYADEGTPFTSGSATASCLELPVVHTTVCHSYGYSAPRELTGIDYHSVGLTPYVSTEVLPYVYAVEGTPSQFADSNSPSVDGSSPLQQHSSGDSFLLGVCKSDALSEEGAQLPSPPPDVSALVSPLNSFHLDELDVAASVVFPLPPPPLVPLHAIASCPSSLKCHSNTIPCGDDHSEEATKSLLPTPLMFSRGTSSYISSVDLDLSSSALPSSPQSEYSQHLPPIADTNSLDYSTTIIAHDDNSNGLQACAVDSLEGVKLEEELAPLAFSNGDGVEEGNEGDEVRLPFAEEGTPQDVLSFTDEQHDNLSGIAGQNQVLSNRDSCGRPLRYSTWAKQSFTNRAASLLEDGADDEDDEMRHSHLIQECIASAMPGSSSFRTTALPFSIAPNNVLFSADDDSVQTFAVEDTPFGGTSTKMSSLSDLFLNVHKPADSGVASVTVGVVPNDLNNCDPFAHSKNGSSAESAGRPSSSNSSSINGDTSSDLLSEVIQSAMPKSLRSDVNTLCPASVDNDCLQLYAVEGTPGEDDLSDCSSMHNIDHSCLNSLALHPSSRCSSTTLPTIPVLVGSLEASGSFPPAPPRRTSSVLSSPRDPFAHSGSNLKRPQAAVAPMPHIARCSPTTAEPSYLINVAATKPTSVRDPGLVTGTDKDDASSFSSMLSIESVGLEHSLLQECISSALPRPKVMDSMRKHSCHHQQHQLWHQLHPELCCAGRPEPLQEEHPSPPSIVSSEKPIERLSDGELTMSTTKSFSICALFQQPTTSSFDTKPVTMETCLLSSPRSSSAPVALSGCPQRKASYNPTRRIQYAFNFLGSGSEDVFHPPQRSEPGISNGGETTGTKVSSRLRSPNVILPKAVRLNSSSIPFATTTSTHTNGTKGFISSVQPGICEQSIPSVDTKTSSQSATTCITTSAVGLSSTNNDNQLLPPSDQAVTLLAKEVENSTGLGSPASDPLRMSSRSLDRNLLELDGHRSQKSLLPSSSVSLPRTSLTTTASSCLNQPSKLTKPSSIPQFHSQWKSHVNSTSPRAIPVAQPAPHPSTATKQRYHSVSKLSTPTRTALKLPSKNLTGYRSSMTCPPSATDRSPFSSRSVSATGSQNNLYATDRSEQSRSPFVSPQSVCAALVKQERVTANTKKSGRSENKTGSLRSTYSVSATSRSNTAASTPHSRTVAIRPLFSSTDRLDESRSVQTTSNFGFGPTTSTSSLSIDVPKPIRGGRKSLTGRKVIDAVGNKTFVKPVVKPNGTLHSNFSSSPRAISLSKSHERSSSTGSRPIKPMNVGPTSATTRLQLQSVENKFPPSTQSHLPCAETNTQHVSPADFDEDANCSSGLWIVRGELTLVERVS